MPSRSALPLALAGLRIGPERGQGRAEGVVEIEAPAPSLVVLEAMAAGSLAVTPMVREGGMGRARCYVNGKEAEYGELVEAELAAGSMLRLECVVSDGTGCWNYWKIATGGALSTIPGPLCVARHSHLGDALAVLVSAEAYAVCNGLAKIRVGGTPRLGELLAQFEFAHVEYTQGPGTDADPLFAAAPWDSRFMERFALGLHGRFGGVRPFSVLRPKLRRLSLRPREDVIVCQFDARSSGCHPVERLKEVLSHHDGLPRVVLGGPDTQPYLGPDIEYRVGPLPFILEQLESAAYHIGTDSGVAHLAAAVGLPSVVYPGPAMARATARGMFSGYPRTTVCMAEHPPRPRRLYVAEALSLRDGSHWGAPRRHFRFLEGAAELDASVGPTAEEVRNQVLVLGGGSLLPHGVRGLLCGAICPADLRIAWSVGHTGAGSEGIHAWDIKAMLDGYELISVRDADLGYEWVPCPSCMHSAFDREYPVRFGAVAYERADHPRLGLPLPAAREDQWDLTTEAGLQAVLRHLGSGAKVVTNSYYGVYWATLLGRPVAYVGECCPYRFRHKPATGIPDQWPRLLQEARPYANALSECRRANTHFAVRVKALLRDYGALE
jgi:hypothetical protein